MNFRIHFFLTKGTFKLSTLKKTCFSSRARCARIFFQYNFKTKQRWGCINTLLPKINNILLNHQLLQKLTFTDFNVMGNLFYRVMSKHTCLRMRNKILITLHHLEIQYRRGRYAYTWYSLILLQVLQTQFRFPTKVDASSSFKLTYFFPPSAKWRTQWPSNLLLLNDADLSPSFPAVHLGERIH